MLSILVEFFKEELDHPYLSEEFASFYVLLAYSLPLKNFNNIELKRDELAFLKFFQSYLF